MSTFGKVVPGVGTMQAAAVAGGVAAMLQVASVTLATSEAAAVGGAAGAMAGALATNKGKFCGCCDENTGYE